jgi:DNA-directed RNA polymerase subunit RPC12/RpoP
VPIGDPFRASLCGHCRRAGAVGACAGCGLWACAACAARPCREGRAAWTGRCRDCGELYPDAQRRDVLDDGDGLVACPRCGWTRRLCRRSLVPRDVAAALTADPGGCATCGYVVADPDDHLVLHVPAGGQALYHLLCRCGDTLASRARPSV